MPKPLPTKITPCPIAEVILEIRFETKSPGEAVFGLLYNEFRHDFPTIEKQPILQLPEHIRSRDPQLMYSPEYRLASTDFSLLVGRRTFAIATIGDYCGWPLLSERVHEVFTRVNALDFITSVTRFGLRYINAFDFDILSRSTLKLIRGDAPLESRSTQVVVQIPAGDLEHTLRVATGTIVKKGPVVLGESIIDIDTAYDTNTTTFFADMDRIISRAHEEEKALFFSLLSDELLNSLKPEFGEDSS